MRCVWQAAPKTRRIILHLLPRGTRDVPGGGRGGSVSVHSGHVNNADTGRDATASEHGGGSEHGRGHPDQSARSGWGSFSRFPSDAEPQRMREMRQREALHEALQWLTVPE